MFTLLRQTRIKMLALFGNLDNRDQTGYRSEAVPNPVAQVPQPQDCRVFGEASVRSYQVPYYYRRLHVVMPHTE